MRLRWMWLSVGLVAALMGGCGDSEDAVATTASPVTTLAAPVTTLTDAAATTAAAPNGGINVDAASLADAPEADFTATPGVLLFEDFQDGAATGWDVDFGWFVFGSADSLALSASGDAWAWFPPGGGWSRYVLRLAARVDAGGLAVSWDVSSAGRYLITVSEDGVFLLEDRPWGTFTPLASASPVAMGQWHVFTVGRDGGHIQVYIDGALWIDHQVADPLPGGTIGVGALPGSAVVVDNVLVTALQRAFPPGDPVAAALPPPDQLDPDPPPVIEDPLEEGDPDTEALLPNLSLESVRFDRETYRVGESATVEIDVHVNMAFAGPVDVVMMFFFDEFCRRTLGDFGGAETVTVTCVTPVFTEEGELPWWAEVDFGNEVPEDEASQNADNVAMGALFIEPPEFILVEDPKPDLKIDDFALVPWQSNEGDPIEIQVAVAQVNREYRGPLQAFDVELTIDNVPAIVWTADPNAGPNWAFGHVLPGVLDAGRHTFSLMVDPGDAVDEAFEDGPIPGVFDVVGGYTVDLRPHPTITYSAVGVHPAGLIPATISYNWENLESGEWPGLEFHTTLVFPETGWRCEATSDVPAMGMVCAVEFPELGEYDWVLTVDDTNVYAETDETNNMVEGTITIVAP